MGSKLNCAFGDFIPLMEGRTLLINTVDNDDHHRGHFLEWVSLPSDIREVAQPWPDTIYRQTFSDPYVYGYWTAYECMGIEEFGVVYGRYSGRLWVADAITGKAKEITLPWSASALTEPARDRESILSRVPKCLQFVPAPGGRLLVIWDPTSVAKADGTYEALGRGRGGLKAITLALGTGECQDVEVPPGLALPLMSPDGWTLAPLKPQGQPPPAVDPTPRAKPPAKVETGKHQP